MDLRRRIPILGKSLIIFLKRGSLGPAFSECPSCSFPDILMLKLMHSKKSNVSRMLASTEVWQSGLMMSSKIWAILTFWVMECEWSVAAKTNDLIVCKSHAWSSYIITSRGSTQNCSFFQSVPNFRFKSPDNVDWLHWWTCGSQLYRLLWWSGKLATHPRPQTSLTQKSPYKHVVSYKCCMKPSRSKLWPSANLS